MFLSVVNKIFHLVENNNSSEKRWELVNFCEFDKYAVKSYCAIHNVDESLNLGDITKIDEHNISQFNMICGGSPCQDFSVAGKQKGSVWTCKDCGHEYNPLTVHWSERDKCPKCGSKMITKIDRMNGYLGFTRVHGKTRYNEAKNAEIKDRVSM